jgi:hypothetical protein
MAYNRIELTKPYFYPDDSWWRNTTPGLARESDYYPGGRYYDSQTDYAWQDPNYAYLDSIGYAPQYDARGRVIYSDGRVDDGGYSSGGSSGGSGGLYSMYGGGIDYLSQQQAALQDARAQAEAALRSRVDAAIGDINAQQAEINRTADQSATQAYIARMKAERGMPQQQAALGLSGGASESAMLGLNTGYENSRNAIMRDRDAQIQANIDLQNKVRLEGDAALSDIQNAYAMKELDLLQDYANRQAQYEQMVYQAELAQQQWEQQQAANWEKYERERKDYLSDVMSEREWKEAQTQAEREYQMMLQRMKGSSGGSGSSSGGSQFTTSEILSMYDKGLIDDATANEMLGLAGAAAPAATGRMKMLDDWFASMTPQQFQANVASGIARGLLSEDVYDEWARSRRR